MQKRGPKSSEERSALKVIPGEFGTRVDAPGDLTTEEAVIWREVVASEAAEMFATAATRGLLKDYCRHRAAADKLTRVINLFQDDWLRNSEGSKRFSYLLKARDGEVRAATSMATKLRLTNQSRYDTKTANTAGKGAVKGYRPWDAL